MWSTQVGLEGRRIIIESNGMLKVRPVSGAMARDLAETWLTSGQGASIQQSPGLGATVALCTRAHQQAHHG